MVVRITVKYERYIGGTQSSCAEQKIIYAELPFIESDIIKLVAGIDRAYINHESIILISVIEADKYSPTFLPKLKCDGE